MHKKRMMLIAIPAFLLLVILIAPFLEPYGYYTHLDGSAGIIDHQDLWNSSDPISGLIYTIGDVLCHQTESRSFMLNGSQLPVCARDFSVLIGVFLGVIVASLISTTKRMKYVSTAMVMPMVIEWITETVTSFDSLFMRATTGILAGIGLAFLFEIYFMRRTYPNVPDIQDDL